MKSSVTTPSTASTESTTSRRARRWARRLRSRRRAACRERGEAIGATVAHACAGFTGCRRAPRTGLRSLRDEPGADDPGPALDPARRPARAAARRISARAAARARALPVPHRRRDRVHAQPARPRPDRACGSRAAPRWRSSRWSSRRRSSRCSSPSARSSSPRPARPATGSTRTSRRRAPPRGRPGAEADVDRLQQWLDDHGLERHPDRAAARRPDRLDRGGRRLGLRAGRDLVRPGRGALGDPLPLLRRPRDRDRDLHAARHAAARGRRSTAASRRGAACR